jgi:hypothetical protein
VQFTVTISKRTAALAAVLAAAAVAAAGGLAFFTASGSGTATAVAGTPAALTINQEGQINDLLPGGTPAPVAFTIDNTSSGDVNVGIVTVTISSVSPTTGNVCPASNFTVTPATTAPGAIAKSATFDSTNTPTTESTIQLNNTTANQDGCEGATINLSFSS